MSLYTFADKGGQSVTAQQLDSNFQNLQNQIAAILGGSTETDLQALAATTTTNAAAAAASATTAGTQAATATTQAGIATTQAGVATAAVASLAGLGTTYLAYAAGNGFAIVDPAGYACFYVSPTALRHPVIDAIVKQTSIQPAGNAFAITDGNDNALVVIDPQKITHPQIAALQTASDSGLAARTTIAQADGPPAWAITDPAGYAAAVVTKDKILHPQISSMSKDIALGRLYQMAGGDGGNLGIFTMSQSLGIGYGFAAQPAMTGVAAALAYAYKFIGGVRIQDLGPTIPTDLASLVPFAEQDKTIVSGGTTYLGETHSGGLIWTLAALLLAENGIDLASERVRMTLGAPGTSGTSAYSLLTGAAMTNFNSMISYGKAGSEAKGLPWRGCVAMPYIQGEQDYVEGTDPTLWKGYIRAIRDSAAAQNATTLGAPRTPTVFPYQISSHLYYSVATPSLALAFGELETEVHFGRMVPTHNLARSGGDNLHLTVLSYFELGARIGTQIKRRLIDKKDGVGIRAGQATVAGGIVTVPINWLNGSAASALTVDTAIGTVANYGFQLYDAGNSPVTITSVVVNSNNVQLNFSTGTPTEWRYGWTGFNAYWGFGQIRDLDTLAVVGPNGGLFRLPNWLPISKGTII